MPLNEQVPLAGFAVLDQEQDQLLLEGEAAVADAFQVIEGSILHDVAQAHSLEQARERLRKRWADATRQRDGLAEAIAGILTSGQVVGRYHALRDVLEPTLLFAEAIPKLPRTWGNERVVRRALGFLESKDLLTPAQFQGLTDSARQGAFTIAGVTRKTMLSVALDGLADSMRRGETPFQAGLRVNARLAARGYDKLRPWHATLVAEQNFAQAYGAASWDALHDKRVADLIPYFRYFETTLVLGLGTPRPLHVKYHNRFYKRDNPIWNLIWPPNGFRCRCKVVGVTVNTVRTYGIREDRVPTMNGRPVQPDPGFRSNPRAYLRRAAAAA